MQKFMRQYEITITVDGQRFPYTTQAPSRDVAILQAGMAYGMERAEPFPGSIVRVQVSS